MSLLVLLAALTTLAGPGIVRAQSAPQVLDTTIQTRNFPEEVAFQAPVRNGGRVETAVLFYTVLPEGALTRLPAEVEHGDVTRLSASVITRGADFYIPVGADFRWYWELTTDNGEIQETEPKIWRYEDPRYEWVGIEQGQIQVHYYADEDTAAELAEEGANAVEVMSALLGITVDFPLKVYVWRSEADASGVQRVRSEGFDEQVITGGVRVLADLVHIYDPSRWVMRHELTHILTKVAGEGAFGNLPAWLDEGTATIAEGDWQRRRGGALQRAIDRDTVLPVRGMGSNTNVAGQVDLFYGQSAALVTYLIDAYGSERLADLFAAFKAGSTVDNALLSVYGFDRDGLDDAWRTSVGLPPRERGEDRSTVIEDEVIGGTEVAEPAPVAEPQGSDGSSPTERPQETGGDTQSDEANEAGAGEADDESGLSADSRSEEEVAARKAEITHRQSERRAGPSFASGKFVWEYVLIAAAGAVLLLCVVLFLQMLSPGPPTSSGYE